MPAFRHLRAPLVLALRAEAAFIAFAIALAMVQGALALLTPWFAGRFVTDIFDAEPTTQTALAVLFSLWIVVLIAQAVARFLSTYLLTRSGARILAGLSSRLHDHLLALPLPFFESRSRGDLLSLHSHDVTTLAHFLSGTLAGFVPTVAVLLGALVMMASIDLPVAGLVALLAPAFFIVLKLIGRGLRDLSKAVADEQAAKLALAGEQLGLMPLVKGFGRQEFEAGLFTDRVRSLLGTRCRQLKRQALLAPAMQLLASLAILMVLWLSADRLQQGYLELGEVVSLLLYGLLFTRPLSGLANLYGEASQSFGAAARLESIFAEASEPETIGAGELATPNGVIEVKDLYFAYPNQPPVFAGLNLSVAAGEIVAVTGPNGAGKSTFLHLLMRFMDPQAGRICIDGTDIAHMALNNLRSHVALVTQDVMLRDGSVADNIRFSDPYATDEDVESAARLAQAHGFIQELRCGYNTQVGENGIRLSGGQCQRIALARALLADPRVLLLDEATALFDHDGEKALLHSAISAFAGRTVIMVTHRSATIAIADRVLRLQNGALNAVSDGEVRRIQAI